MTTPTSTSTPRIAIQSRVNATDFAEHVLAPESGFTFLSIAENSAEMQIHSASKEWWLEPDVGTPISTVYADLAAIAPDRGRWHDVFGRPHLFFTRRAQRIARRVRMARKRRRGWA